MCRLVCASCVLGAEAAKYAGKHVHQSLVKDEAYKEERYTDALKHAFLNADADMKTGMLYAANRAL